MSMSLENETRKAASLLQLHHSTSSLSEYKCDFQCAPFQMRTACGRMPFNDQLSNVKWRGS